MSKIVLKQVCLKYPIYGDATRSLKRDMLNFLTFRKKSSEAKGITCVNALKKISFTLNDGDSVGLIGHNGAGKSTLLKLLSGIYQASQGSIIIHGSVASVLGSSVGMQYHLTGYENIRLGGMINGCSNDEIDAIAQDVRSFTELGDFLSVPIGKYSLGMQARLAFAISTALNPDILLLDEVMGTGDARFINKAQQRLHDLIGKANILVFASHSIEMIKQFCNKAIWLDQGCIKGFGPVNLIITDYLEDMSRCTV